MDKNAIYNRPQNLIRKHGAIARCIETLEQLKENYPPIFNNDPMINNLLDQMKGNIEKLVEAMDPADYKAPEMPATDLLVQYLAGRITGTEYMQRLEELGQDLPLNPSHHGKECIGNGEREGIECQCDECPHYLDCFPDWKEAVYGNAARLS